jgi:hypothetical protein
MDNMADRGNPTHPRAEVAMIGILLVILAVLVWDAFTLTDEPAILAALGVGGAVAARAPDNPAPIVQQSDGDGDVDDATELEGAQEANDGPDQGPDASPNEPGHQDGRRVRRDRVGDPSPVQVAESAGRCRHDGGACCYPQQAPPLCPVTPGTLRRVPTTPSNVRYMS